MNKTGGILSSARPGPPRFDMRLWKDFQAGLSKLLGVYVTLCDADGRPVPSQDMYGPVCEAVLSTIQGRELCSRLYSEAARQVLAENKIHVYKCHANLYFFAIPLEIDPATSYVIIGGRVYLEGNETEDLFKGLERFSFDEITLLKLKREMRTIPGKSIFTVPGIVNNLAVPFLKSLLAEKPAEDTAARARNYNRLIDGFKTLEGVFRSIAPVLDREELYETILMKSTELLGAEKGSLMILDNKNKTLYIKAAKGIDRKVYGDVRVRVGEGISGAIVARGKPMVVRDIEDEVPLRRNIPRYKTKSFISVPLKLDDRVIGVLNVSDKITGEVFSEDDLVILLSFANYATIALERGAYYSMSEEFKMISMTDPLTGLFNRRYFKERLFEEVERVKRHTESFSMFLMDIDDFKAYNDRYGHIAGDELLKKVAREIRSAVRSMDVVARYGGEEFAVILPHTTKEESHIIAERIRREIEEIVPPYGKAGSTTISIGIAEFPHDADSIDELINNSDKAMYTAKRMGKNRVVFYER